MIEVQNSTPRKALLYPSAQVYDWGTTLIIAPRPDHQLLGCGGAIVLLRQMGYRVRVLFVGDGLSAYRPEGHLHSVTELRQISQRESQRAVASLGVSEEASVYFQLRDGLFPQRGEPGFDESVRLVTNQLHDLEPDTVVMPMLSHDDPDLLATWQIVREALHRFSAPLRTIEYFLLNEQREAPVVKPTAEHEIWRLDVKEARDEKIRALQLFRRQETAEVPPPEAVLPWETYVEYRE